MTTIQKGPENAAVQKAQESIPVPQPKQEVSKPEESQKPVEAGKVQEKVITVSHVQGGKWKVEFKGPVKQKDINRLRRMIPVLFSRYKRERRMAKQKKERNEKAKQTEVSKLKETSNAA